MLELQGIRKTFYPGTPNEKKALNGVDLHLNAGDFVTIVGSNGAGKSTLFNAISGVFSVDEGKMCIRDRYSRPKIGCRMYMSGALHMISLWK